MSEENVEMVRRAVEAYELEGLDGVLRYYDPEWTSTEAYIEPATYRGHAGVRRYLGTIEEEFEDLRIEPVELIDAGEQVVSSVRISGRGKASGAEVENRYALLYEFRGDLISRLTAFPTAEEALEAAGLSE